MCIEYVGMGSVTYQLLNLGLDGWAVVLSVSFWFILVGLLLVCCLVRLSGRGSRWKAQKVSLSFRGPAVWLVPNDEVARIAHKAWAELASRKAGIPVEDDDVIIEVYNSWYSLFRALRQLAKEVPVTELHRSSDAKKLLKGLMATMNEVLRPHLTKHQARFRSWWDRPLDATSKSMSPQDRQRTYPQYEDLITDMREVNKNLIELMESLRGLAHEREKIPLYRRLAEARKQKEREA